MSLTATLLLMAPLYPAQVPVPRPLQPIAARELPPAPVVQEELVTFDSLNTRLDWREGRWQIVSGTQLVKDFGTRASEARQAHALIRDLRLTQVGTIGGERPVMEYWLASGQAPQGRAWSMRTITFSTDNLEVEKVRNDWCVRDAKQVLLMFGQHEAQARQALAVIQKYNFNQVGMVGNGTPSMMIFFHQDQRPGGSMKSTRVQPLQTTKHTMRPSAIVPAQTHGKLDAAALAALPPQPLIPSLTPAVEPIQRDQGRVQQVVYKQAQAPNTPVEVAAPILFDGQQVQAVRDNGDWKLQIGNQLLGNFGIADSDAKLAQSAAQYYRFTEYQRLGTGKPALGYFLCSGQAPRGLMSGLNGEVFQPELVMMRQRSTGWVLMQGQRVLVECGSNPADAAAMIEAIRKYRFDGICRIGQGEGALVFFVRFR